MLYSMTGFARESVETDLGTLTWEIRAVNHRYLDIQFKLPEDLESKYKFVTLAAKRAEQLQVGAVPKVRILWSLISARVSGMP